MNEENKKSATGLAVMCFICAFFEMVQIGVSLVGNILPALRSVNDINRTEAIVYVVQTIVVGILGFTAIVLRGVFFLNIRKIGVGAAALGVGLAGALGGLALTILNYISAYKDLISMGGTSVTRVIVINVVPALISIVFVIMILIDFCFKHDAYVMGMIAAIAGVFMWLYTLARAVANIRMYFMHYSESVRQVMLTSTVSSVIAVLTSALATMSMLVYYLVYARENRDWLAGKTPRSN